MKSSRRSSRRRKTAELTKGVKNSKAKQNGKKELRKAPKSKKSSNQGKNSKLTLPLTLSVQALSLR
jgi:hypothetical protein